MTQLPLFPEDEPQAPTTWYGQAVYTEWPDGWIGLGKVICEENELGQTRFHAAVANQKAKKPPGTETTSIQRLFENLSMFTRGERA